MAEVKNASQDLEAQTCKELIDYLRQVADFAGFAASIFTDLSEEVRPRLDSARLLAL